MATEIRMPRLGWTMEEGTFGEWLKQDGDTIKAGDFLFTVEGDKATQEIEAFDDGILRLPPNPVKPGDVITVGTILAYTTRAGEADPFAGQPASQPAAATAEPAAPAPAAPPVARAAQNVNAENTQNAMAHVAISPRARRVATELGVDWRGLTGSGRGTAGRGRIVERDIRAAAELAQQQAAATNKSEEKIRATPVAMRMAQEARIDLAELAAQLPVTEGSRRIERADVEAAIAARAAAPPAQPTTGEVVPVTKVRRLIAQRMSESLHTTASVTLTTEVDATALVALREQLKAAFGARNYPVPSYNDLFAKLTATALEEHRFLNARWQEDEIILSNQVHIGLAVDTPEGLLVPVLRNVQAQGLRQLATQSKQLIEKAQSRKLSADELQGGTFTISNLGMYNIDAFTPIINPPQCAILGIGRIIKKPAVVGDQIVPRQMVALSLTFDHRVVDGAPAARFLDTIRQFVETPLLWLAT
ncbi:MAG: 2-oxo acid dehydrogenase subunit E2 [Caldilineaceae bacterium]|nr:2-oxo acid dehydrogenase subunit E2 [Caldilineaceae bacterium]